jgi:hypothetical protein
MAADGKHLMRPLQRTGSRQCALQFQEFIHKRLAAHFLVVAVEYGTPVWERRVMAELFFDAGCAVVQKILRVLGLQTIFSGTVEIGETDVGAISTPAIVIGTQNVRFCERVEPVAEVLRSVNRVCLLETVYGQDQDRKHGSQHDSMHQSPHRLSLKLRAMG